MERARVCRGADDSVAFFWPDGGVLYDAPPRRMAPSGEREAAIDGPVREDELRLDLPSYRTGAARWARDRDVPFGIEVRALEALERAAGWG